MKYEDYYAILGIPRDADLAQIKKAYRKLAHDFHPDVSKAPDAEARFKDAALAYATLKDPEKRAAYDELGRHPAGEEMAPPPQWAQGFAHGGPRMEDMDLEELLASFGRGGRAHHDAPSAGRDYDSAIEISLEDAHTGTTLSLKLADPGGDRALEVKVPAGVTDGQKLRLRGKGGAGSRGGPSGDIYLHIHVKPHPVFRADHHDLHFTLALAPWEAALGAEIEVQTLDGPVVLTVPPGTRAGRKLRLKERGLANGRGPRGDLFAAVVIDVPARLTPREQELFTELRAASTFNPRPKPPGAPS